MQKLFFTLLMIGVLQVTNAQIINPVKFNYTAVKKGNNQYEIHIKTSIEPKWHIYSVKNPEGGAAPTIIKINDGKLIGGVKEKGAMKTAYSDVFKVKEKYFEHTVDFVQLVKLNSRDKKVTGTIEYMVCNDRQCLPPKELEFNIEL